MTRVEAVEKINALLKEMAEAGFAITDTEGYMVEKAYIPNINKGEEDDEKNW